MPPRAGAESVIRRAAIDAHPSFGHDRPASRDVHVLAFILRRVLQSAVVLVVVAFIAFVLFNYTGDPVSFMVGQDATVEEKAARLRTDLGLDQPFYVQFARFVGNAVQGDFGLSLRQARKVSDAAQGAAAGHARALARGGAARARRSASRSASTRRCDETRGARTFPARRLADRRQPADVPDRHPADPGLRRATWAGCRRSAAARRSPSAGGRPAS